MRLAAASTAVVVATCVFAAMAGPISARANDRPIFVPWNRVGDIWLGETEKRVTAEYGTAGHGYHVIQRYGDTTEGYYLLHGSRVRVTFYGKHVGEFGFTTRYYRTAWGFGVGSAIPLGPCHTSANGGCEHRWHGFVYNPRLRESRCGCWVKVGTGGTSLPPNASNFGKPWFFIYVRHGRASGFYFALRYID